VVVDVIGVILSERFYEDLRTKQQLGYIVSCGVKVLSESRNLSFVVQSSTSPVDKLTSEIFKFVTNARQKFLEPITQNEINSIAKGIVLKKTQPDKKLAIETTRNWNEIATGRLQFDRREQEARALLNLKKDDILDYWDTYILGQNGGRGLLVSEVIPKQGPASSKVPPKSFASKSSAFNKLGVDDIPSYREARERLI
jgi:secreted Zn-dependent insulinase-like peptidase